MITTYCTEIIIYSRDKTDSHNCFSEKTKLYTIPCAGKYYFLDKDGYADEKSFKPGETLFDPVYLTNIPEQFDMVLQIRINNALINL